MLRHESQCTTSLLLPLLIGTHVLVMCRGLPLYSFQQMLLHVVNIIILSFVRHLVHENGLLSLLGSNSFALELVVRVVLVVQTVKGTAVFCCGVFIDLVDGGEVVDV